jgi:hypothetical protein
MFFGGPTHYSKHPRKWPTKNPAKQPSQDSDNLSRDPSAGNYYAPSHRKYTRSIIQNIPQKWPNKNPAK